MNALLADPDQVNVASLLQDGRIGLYVVATLARRHGIAVRLQSNIYGGTQAVLVLPATLLGTVPDAQPAPASLAGTVAPYRAHRRPDGRSVPARRTAGRTRGRAAARAARPGAGPAHRRRGARAAGRPAPCSRPPGPGRPGRGSGATPRPV
ncbi:ATP-binding protein [Streptomyces albus]|nr:ATP-binding protein [Streptomyces albus]